MADLKLKQLEQQLKRIGCNFQFWGRSEVRELAHVLWEGEIVEHCINGFYDGGFAMLAATNQRVLIVDKKPFYLNLEDIRFDMISEIDYNHRLLDASVSISTPNKNMRFTAFNQTRARLLYSFVQTRIMEIREHYMHPTQPSPQYIGVPQPYATAPFPSAEWLTYATQLQQQTMMQPMMLQQQLPQPQPVQPQPTTVGHHFQLPLAPKGVAPIVRAYSRLPMRSRQRRFLGSRALT